MNDNKRVAPIQPIGSRVRVEPVRPGARYDYIRLMHYCHARRKTFDQLSVWEKQQFLR